MKRQNPFEYDTAEDLLALTKKFKLTIGEVAIKDSANDYALGIPYVVAEMQKRLKVVEDSVNAGLKIKKRTPSGLSGGDAQLLTKIKTGKSLLGDIVHDAITKSFAITENNAWNGKIVAFPTAGSSGVVPAALLALYDNKKISADRLVKGMFAAGAAGIVVAKNAMISGAAGGCQAEIGSAGAMAACGLAEMLGLSAEQALDAAAITLKGMLGLVCDPIAGLVECPCIKRNAMALTNAFVAVEMVSAGIKSNVPFDEVVVAMREIGYAMNPRYKETAEGGIATTKTGRMVWKKLFGKDLAKAETHKK